LPRECLENLLVIPTATLVGVDGDVSLTRQPVREIDMSFDREAQVEVEDLRRG
jgi:hypothetical protein